MQEDQHLNDEEKQLIQSLSTLMPEAPGVSEQTIWYQAGLRAGRRQVNVWRGVAAAIILVAGGVLVMRTRSATQVDIVRVQTGQQLPVIASTQSDAPQNRVVASVDYLQLRDAVEQHGLEALPQSSGSGVLSQPAQTPWPSQPSQPGVGESSKPKGSL